MEPGKMQDIPMRVLENTAVNDAFMRIDLDPAGMDRPLPGQFVNVRVAEGDDVLLRRPFSVFAYTPERVSLLYRVVGRGTEALASRKPGDEIRVLGPLGNPFPVPEGPAVVVGGGIGIPPIHFFAERIAADGVDIISCTGFRSGDEVLLQDSFEKLCTRSLVATDDGSAGVPGTVIDALDTLDGFAPETTVYACGPEPMLRALKAWAAERGLKLYVSLEAYMGCGFGVCLSCAVKHRSGDYVRACTEGPVFDAEEVEL